MRRWRVVALIVVAASFLSCCGSDEPTATSTALSTATGSGSISDPCPPDASVPCGPAPTASLVPAGCGVVTADMVTSALGETATFLGTDASGCGFSAGRWEVGVSAVANDPAAQATATGPTLPGAEVPHVAWLNNDRSGRWQVMGSLVVGGVLYTFSLRNDATGSDTYPGFDGPEQRPATADAAVALVNAIARAG